MELYGIACVSGKIGIHESTLRRWEEMGLISPDRICLGKDAVRVYTAEQIELLLRVKELMDRGITLRTAFGWAEYEAE